MDKRLSFRQFLEINSKLMHISDTWSDLWVMIYYTQLSVGSLIRLKYDDISDNSFNTGKRGRLEELRIESTAPIKQILERRRKRYPDDIYVFQSHSNRVKKSPRPVTVIAFNAALRKAGATRPGLPVSSSSAKYITG